MNTNSISISITENIPFIQKFFQQAKNLEMAENSDPSYIQPNLTHEKQMDQDITNSCENCTLVRDLQSAKEISHDVSKDIMDGN
jgi:hypothetical protein